MQSVDSASANMLSERSHLVLAGGVDALSRVPLLFSEAMVNWLARWSAAKSFGQRAALLTRFRPAFLAPVIGIMRGLTDPISGLLMGQTAENVAHRFSITREQMDAYAARSHSRVLNAQKSGYLNIAHDGLHAEIAPLFDGKGRLYKDDDGVRTDSTPENLARLRPFFDRTYGSVTAGNSSQITDGGVWLLMADEEGVRRHGLTPIGRIIDAHWSGLDPAQMGLGPVHAATPLLKRHGLGLNDLDLWEINEAFAAQVLGCLEAWKSDAYCREMLGLDGAMGELDMERLNIDGGAIAMGHPVGASGTRIVLHLLHALKRTGGRRGMAAICIGGGLGGAMLLEAL
jgi:acetyl-CoA C-acetyltransferase